MTEPLVSVHIAVYNYAEYVGEAIQSVLDQTLREVECIVVDDASTDDSWDVAQRYASDPRVVLIRHPGNRGHLAAYETGIAAARGAYVVTLGADDRAIDRDALRIQSEVLASDPRLGLCFTDFDVIDARGDRLEQHRIAAPERLAGHVAFRRLLFENFIMHGGTMVPRRCFRELGTYDRRFFHGADRELWLRIAARYDLAHVARPLWGYRLHPRNMHTSYGYEDSLRETTELIDTAIAYAPIPEEGLRDRAVAHNYVTRAAVWLRRRQLSLAARDLLQAYRLDPTALFRAELIRGLVRGAIPARR